MAIINNKLEIGNEFRRKLKITESLMNNFGELASDYNPIHTDEAYAKSKGYKGKVSYGNILGLLLSSLVGESLKEYEVMLISQSIKYKKPVFIGDVITLQGVIKEINNVYQVVTLKLRFSKISGEICASGNCMVKFLNE